MNQPYIIAIETSSRHGSVALAAGEHLLEEIDFSADLQHARDLIPAIQKLTGNHNLTPNQIGQCYLSIGPGSFTGLRVAVTFARHFALATGAAICPVPTLDVIAQNGLEMPEPPRRLRVILDAKQSQVYTAVYQWKSNQYRRTTGPEMIVLSSVLSDEDSSLAMIGEGIDYHQEAVRASGVTVLDQRLWFPHARCVCRLGWQLASKGQLIAPAQLEPCYLRRPEAEALWEKRHGRCSPIQRGP